LIVLRILFYIIVFCLTLIYFLPKNEIVSYINTTILPKYELSAKIKLENDLLDYQAINSQIVFQNNPTANIDTIQISPYLFINTINLNNIKLKGMAGSVFPNKIEKADIKYSVLTPTKVMIDVVGDFGKAKGYFDISKSLVHFEVTASSLLIKKYSFILKMMKKSKKIYIYEYKL